jgi:hypothetical protein
MLCRVSAPRSSKRKTEAKVCGLLGVGLDGVQGECHTTRGTDFYLVGGSAETHERMQDLVLRMREKLKGKGKRFSDLTSPEFEDLARDSLA